MRPCGTHAVSPAACVQRATRWQQRRRRERLGWHWQPGAALALVSRTPCASQRWRGTRASERGAGRVPASRRHAPAVQDARGRVIWRGAQAARLPHHSAHETRRRSRGEHALVADAARARRAGPRRHAGQRVCRRHHRGGAPVGGGGGRRVPAAPGVLRRDAGRRRRGRERGRAAGVGRSGWRREMQARRAEVWAACCACAHECRPSVRGERGVQNVCVRARTLAACALRARRPPL